MRQCWQTTTQNCVGTHKNLKRRQALRIATQSPDRWTRRAADWNPGLIISTRTQREAGRPAKIWEDDLMSLWKMKKLRLLKVMTSKKQFMACSCEQCLWMGKERKTIREACYRWLKNPTLHNTTKKYLHVPPPTTTSKNSNITSGRERSWTLHKSRVEFVKSCFFSLWFFHTSRHTVVLECNLKFLWANSAHLSTRFTMFFRWVTTPSLMPTGPDAQQLLDTSSMSVVIVFVIVKQSTCVGCIVPSTLPSLRKKPNVPSHT